MKYRFNISYYINHVTKNATIVLLFLIGLCISCKKAVFEFNDEEKAIYTIYNVGDTLQFESVTTGKKNVFIIMKKTSDLATNGSFNKFRYGEIYYRNILDALYTDSRFVYPDIIQMTKFKKSHATEVDFEGFFNSYPDDNFGVLNSIDTISYYNQRIINYYTLISQFNNLTIIWHPKYGVVKYNDKTGESFIRTNIPAYIH